MFSLKNDYSEIAHQNILDIIYKSSLEQNNGYGLDKHSEKAKELIKKHIGIDADIHFLVGGTSCNKIVISHVLKPFEAVISVSSGHINVHETGAIEASGHKVLTTPGINGKISSQEIIDICSSHRGEHMVTPKMVYISNSTEIGTIYTKSELIEISNTCKSLNLFLYLDGARLGVALTSEENDLSLKEIAVLTDAFYIGGTKNGAMLGEALVITNEKMKDSFRHSIKLNGGMLAKGFISGIQFEGLFTDDLFFKLGKHANNAAKHLKNGLKTLNVEFLSNSLTNQQFIILDNQVVEVLKKDYEFEIWERFEKKTAIRLVTSWATNLSDLDKFLEDLKLILIRNSQ